MTIVTVISYAWNSAVLFEKFRTLFCRPASAASTSTVILFFFMHRSHARANKFQFQFEFHESFSYNKIFNTTLSLFFSFKLDGCTFYNSSGLFHERINIPEAGYRSKTNGAPRYAARININQSNKPGLISHVCLIVRVWLREKRWNEAPEELNSALGRW